MSTARRRRLLVLAGALAVAHAGWLAGEGILGALGDPSPCVRAARIDLNRASIAELTTLDGVGPTRAAAIVLHRVRHGPLRRLEDLLRIDGIGPDTLSGVAAFVVDPREAVGRQHP